MQQRRTSPSRSAPAQASAHVRTALTRHRASRDRPRRSCPAGRSQRAIRPIFRPTWPALDGGNVRSFVRDTITPSWEPKSDPLRIIRVRGTGTSVTLLGIINDSLSSPVAPAADMCLPGSDFPHVDGNTTLKLQLTTRTIVPAEHGPTHGIMMWWWHRSTRHRPSSASSGTSLLGELSLNTRNPGNTIR